MAITGWQSVKYCTTLDICLSAVFKPADFKWHSISLEKTTQQCIACCATPPPTPPLTVQISQRRQHDIKGNLAVSGSINIPSPALSRVMREQLPSQEGGKKKSFVWKLCWSQTSFHAVWLWRQETAHFYDAKSQKLVKGRLKKKKNPFTCIFTLFYFLAVCIAFG